MPNKTVYSSDIWDEKYNEKIERNWLKGGVNNPRYSRLTTFRGLLNFPKLTEQQELLYQSIKDEKRNVIAQDKGLEDVDDKDPFEVVYKALLDGKVKNTAMLEGMMVAHDLNIDSTKSKLRRVLKENSKSTKLTQYYFDDQEYKKEEKQKRKQNELTALISQVKSQQSNSNA
jgi:hypothetical protein